MIGSIPDLNQVSNRAKSQWVLLCIMTVVSITHNVFQLFIDIMSSVIYNLKLLKYHTYCSNYCLHHDLASYRRKIFTTWHQGTVHVNSNRLMAALFVKASIWKSPWVANLITLHIAHRASKCTIDIINPSVVFSTFIVWCAISIGILFSEKSNKR